MLSKWGLHVQITEKVHSMWYRIRDDQMNLQTWRFTSSVSPDCAQDLQYMLDENIWELFELCSAAMQDHCPSKSDCCSKVRHHPVFHRWQSEDAAGHQSHRRCRTGTAVGTTWSCWWDGINLVAHLIWGTAFWEAWTTHLGTPMICSRVYHEQFVIMCAAIQQRA